MTPKDMILDSIKYAREKMGYTLIYGAWGKAEDKSIDAIGAVLCANNPDEITAIEGTDEELLAVAGILGVSYDWVYNFLDGYDGLGDVKHASDPDGWTIGQEIFEEAKPMEDAEYYRGIHK